MCETNRWCLFENDLQDWETDVLSLGPYSLERPAKELLENFETRRDHSFEGTVPSTWTYFLRDWDENHCFLYNKALSK